MGALQECSVTICGTRSSGWEPLALPLRELFNDINHLINKNLRDYTKPQKRQILISRPKIKKIVVH